MKTNRIACTTVLVLLLLPTLACGQRSDEQWDLMLIREDHVHPSMTVDYEMTLMDMKEFLDEKNVTGFNYFTHMQDDYIFSHVSPVRQLEDLSNGIHAFVAAAVNDPELDLILDYLNEAIASYRYYIVRYRPEFSYIPEGDDWGEGSPYRKWNYYHFKPGTEAEVEAILSAWKQLYEARGIETGFRVFSGLIGLEQPTYILTTWAEDPLDYHQQLQNTMTQLGEDGAALWAMMTAFLNEAETIEGWFLPQYSFAPGLKMAD